MKILIPVLQFGKAGGYRVLSNLANEWINMGHQVHFISTISSNKPYFPTIANVYWVDNKGDFKTEEDLVSEDSYRFWNRWSALCKGMNRLESDYDIVLANQNLTAYALIFSKISGKKFYYIQAYEPEYGWLSGSFAHKLLSLIAWHSYNLKIEKIVNADVYRHYKNIKTDKVVLPGLDLKIFYPENIELIVNPIKLGCIGRLEVYKGTQYVMDAFLVLRQVIPDIELHIAFGDKSLELIEGVTIVSPTNDFELANYYRSMDILIAPGTVQMGAVHYPVIEAMACGTAVITTGYYPAKDSNAWLVPVKNANAIAEQVQSIIKNPSLVDKKITNGLKDVTEFEWSLVASKMLNYFSK